MLSLPEDWDFTLAGLSYINREKIDAIREAVRELEKADISSDQENATRKDAYAVPTMLSMSNHNR
jgi:hypothetical protein